MAKKAAKKEKKAETTTRKPKDLEKARNELRAADYKTLKHTMRRVRRGYSERGNTIKAAVRAPNGCLIGRKALNRPDDGYMQIALIRPHKRGKNGAKKASGTLHPLQRLVVVKKAKRRQDGKSLNILLAQDGEASHLCNTNRCISVRLNPSPINLTFYLLTV